MSNTPKIRPITDEVTERAVALGMDLKKLPFLLRAGQDYEYDHDGNRIEPEIAGGAIDWLSRENHHMIKPDPKGVFYLKLTLKGKTHIKPLSKDEVEARVMRDKWMNTLGYDFEAASRQFSK